MVMKPVGPTGASTTSVISGPSHTRFLEQF